MLFVLGVSLALLVTISVARIAFLKDLGPLTVGSCALGAAFLLYLPSVDRWLDPAAERAIGIANLSDIVHILLTLLTWWALGVAALRVLRRESPLHAWIRKVMAENSRVREFLLLLRGDRSPDAAAERVWGIASLCEAIAVAVVWAFAGLRTTEVGDMLELHDAGTRTLAVMYSSWALVGGVLVVTACLIGLRAPAPPEQRIPIWVILGAGFCGAGYTTTAALVVLFGGTSALRENAQSIMAFWAIPGLALLAFGGTAALVRGAHRRCATGHE
ncbi:hypothetical protein [Nocardia brasiliensis]|uniref:hypothetical protein n=1 Tax=Nocardia brasiliensis TaxID=37326 RepID=UPI003402F449